MRFIRFIRAKDPLLVEKFLNELKGATITSIVWDGNKWVAWVVTTNKKMQSGDIDK